MPGYCKFMRKINYILTVLILILFSCDQKNFKEELEQEIFYYPEKEKFEQNLNYKNIFIDSLRNYKELINEIDRIACQDATPIVNYSTREGSFKKFCPGIVVLKRTLSVVPHLDPEFLSKTIPSLQIIILNIL